MVYIEIQRWLYRVFRPVVIRT